MAQSVRAQVGEPAGSISGQSASDVADLEYVRARRGDQAALGRLVQACHPMVEAVAYARLQNHDSAEDLAQEVFLRLVLHISELPENLPIRPWLVRVTRNLACDWQRRGMARSRMVESLMNEFTRAEAVASSPHTTPLEKAEQEATLEAALGLLSPDDRELLLLHYSENLTKSELARRLGVHPSTVSRSLDRAIAQVQAQMEPDVPAERRRSAAAAEQQLRKALLPRPAAAARAAALVVGFAALPLATREAVAAHASATLTPAASPAALLAAAEATLPAATHLTAKVAWYMNTKYIVSAVAATVLMGGGYVAMNPEGVHSALFGTMSMAGTSSLLDSPLTNSVPIVLTDNQEHKLDFQPLEVRALEVAIPGREVKGRLAVHADRRVELRLTNHKGDTWQFNLDNKPATNEAERLRPRNHVISLNLDDKARELVVESIMLEPREEGVRLWWYMATRSDVFERLGDLAVKFKAGEIPERRLVEEGTRVVQEVGMLPSHPPHREIFLRAALSQSNPQRPPQAR